MLLLLWLHYTALRLPYVWLCNGQALETRTVTQGDQLRWCTVAAVRHMAWRMDHARLCVCLAAVLTAVVASASASAVLCPPLLFSDGRSASRDAHVGGEAEGVGATTTARRASAQHKDGGGRRGGHGGRPPRRLGADDWQVKGGREEMRVERKQRDSTRGRARKESYTGEPMGRSFWATFVFWAKIPRNSAFMHFCRGTYISAGGCAIQGKQ